MGVGEGWGIGVVSEVVGVIAGQLDDGDSAIDDDRGDSAANGGVEWVDKVVNAGASRLTSDIRAEPAVRVGEH